MKPIISTKEVVIAMAIIIAIVTLGILSSIYVVADAESDVEYSGVLVNETTSIINTACAPTIISYMNLSSDIQTDEDISILSNPDNKIEDEEESSPSYDYIIKQGDSFWSIAASEYGDGSYYEYLAESNGLTANSYIYAGQTLVIYSDTTDDDIALIQTVTSNTETQQVSADIVEDNTETASTEEHTGTLADVFNATSISDYSNLTYYGSCKITGYDPWCAHCCGKTDGITASGYEAVIGVTVGMTGLPLGTKIYIEGYGYFTVQDTGNVDSYHVDVACASHEDCYQVTGRADVYIVNG